MPPGKKPVHVLPWIQSQVKIPESGVRLFEDDKRTGFVIYDKREVGRRYSVLRQGRSAEEVETYLWFERLDSCVQKHGLKRSGKKTDSEVVYFLPKDGKLMFTADVIETPPTKEHRRKRRMELAARRRQEKESLKVPSTSAASDAISPQESYDSSEQLRPRMGTMNVNMNVSQASPPPGLPMRKADHGRGSAGMFGGYRPPEGAGGYFEFSGSSGYGAGVGAGVGSMAGTEEGGLDLTLGLATGMEAALANPSDKDFLMALVETCVTMLSANERVEILRNIAKGIAVQELSLNDAVSGALESVTLFVGRARMALNSSSDFPGHSHPHRHPQSQSQVSVRTHSQDGVGMGMGLEQQVDALLSQFEEKTRELNSLRTALLGADPNQRQLVEQQQQDAVGKLQVLHALLSPSATASSAHGRGDGDGDGEREREESRIPITSVSRRHVKREREEKEDVDAHAEADHDDHVRHSSRIAQKMLKQNSSSNPNPSWPVVPSLPGVEDVGVGVGGWSVAPGPAHTHSHTHSHMQHTTSGSGTGTGRNTPPLPTLPGGFQIPVAVSSAASSSMSAANAMAHSHSHGRGVGISALTSNGFPMHLMSAGSASGSGIPTLFSPTASSDIQFGSRLLRNMSGQGNEEEMFLRQDSGVYMKRDDVTLETYGVSGVGKARL